MYHVFISSFDQTVDKIVDILHKLTQLLRFTTGEAHHAIEGCAIIGGKAGYQRARDILETRFGDKNKINQSIIEHLCQKNLIKGSEDLQKLADDLVTADLTFDTMKKTYDSQDLISKICSRLNRYHNNRWRNHALDYKEKHDEYPDFKNFVKFISRSAADANDPLYGFKDDLATKNKKSSKGYTHTVCDKPVKSAPTSHSCPKCKGSHRLYICDQFKGLDNDSKYEFVKCNKLCFNCLLPKHSVSQCKSPVNCRYCGRRHNSLLHMFQSVNSVHGDSHKLPVNVNVDSVSVSGNAIGAQGDLSKSFAINASTLNPNARDFTSSHVNSNIVSGDVPKVMLPLVKVTVNDKISTHALLDPASTHSFIKLDLAEKLNISGIKSKLTIATMNLCSNNVTQFFSLKVTGTDGCSVNIPRAYQVNDIPVPEVRIFQNYEHLKDLPSPDPLNVSILIGQDCSEALMPLEVKFGKPEEPYAVRTRLGWYICGSVPESNCSPSAVVSLCVSSKQNEINTLWEMDQESYKFDERLISQEDNYVLQLWEDSIKSINGKYELPIPWKSGRPHLPNNQMMAQKRLDNLLSKLEREELYDKYCDQIKKYLQKGYDCAAKYNGFSLNESCYQGPDLNNPLFGVLLRFRLEPYALTADIESMYMQVKVPSEDRNALRFLWINDDGHIVHLRMTSHLFGGVWCPSASIFALRKTAELNDVKTKIKDIIFKSFYVDDLLKSFPNRSDLEDGIISTKAVLKLGGFNLTKFMCNDETAMNMIPKADHAAEARLPKKGLKTLGVKWNIDQDRFHFSINTEPSKVQKITKREMLRSIASIFDPLGIISPVVLKGRCLLQEATRSGYEWDQDIYLKS